MADCFFCKVFFPLKPLMFNLKWKWCSVSPPTGINAININIAHFQLSATETIALVKTTCFNSSDITFLNVVALLSCYFSRSRGALRTKSISEPILAKIYTASDWRKDEQIEDLSLCGYAVHLNQHWFHFFQFRARSSLYLGHASASTTMRKKSYVNFYC